MAGDAAVGHVDVAVRRIEVDPPDVGSPGVLMEAVNACG